MYKKRRNKEMDDFQWFNLNTDTNTPQQPDKQQQPTFEINQDFGYQIEKRGIQENADTKTMSLDSPGGGDDE
jgi:hypothetical protein